MSDNIKNVWVTYTNTDCNEGRGMDIPIAICELQSTAIRLGKKRYVQGSNGPIKKVTVIKIDDKWYFPKDACYIIPPTKEDIEKEQYLQKQTEIYQKLKTKGFSEEEINIIKQDFKQ